MTKAARDRKLTAAIVVRGDGLLVRETLESIADTVDEIVIVSTDTECDLAGWVDQWQARVIKHPWEQSFADAKNAALHHITGEWVLWMSPGETMGPEDCRQLRDFVNSQVDIMTAYVLLVKSPLMPGTIGSEQLGEVRLVPQHPGIRFNGRVRETMFQSLAECGMSVEAIPLTLVRSQRHNDAGWKNRKSVLEAQLVELEIQETGPTARMMICMAEAVQNLGDQDNALLFYDQACRLADHASADMLEAFYGILTALDGRPDSLETQIQTCLTALEIFPLDAQLLCAIGGYLQTKGHLDLARRSFETAYRHGQVNLETWHIDDIDEIAASCLATTTSLCGRQQEAEAILLESLRELPHSIRLRRQVIDLHVKHGRREEALAELERLPADYAPLPLLRSAVHGALLAARKDWIAARPYLEAAYRQGSREPLCLRWFSTTLAALGELKLAREVLESWIAHDPKCGEARELLTSLIPSTAQKAG